MTFRVRLLSGEPISNATYCLLWPLLRFRRTLAQAGIQLTVQHIPRLPHAATDADIVLIEGRAFGKERDVDQGRLLQDVERLSKQVPVVWVDNYDSSGLLFSEVLPFVRAYWKSQLLSDRTAYLQPMYGGRPYTDYYHANHGIADDVPITSTPVASPHLLDRLAVAWNMGLANHGYWARWLERLYGIWHLPGFMQPPRGFCDSTSDRPVALTARFGANYTRQTVAHQRKAMLVRLAGRMPTDRLSRSGFRREMSHAKAAISPFGWGEVCLRDFEAFIAGAALVKPDMSHLETWPNWYVPGFTYLPIKWDLSDMDEVLASIAADQPRTTEIARNGQELYRTQTITADAGTAFLRHFSDLLGKAI
ncbi:MAG: hypothetical protein VW600_02555 [Ferrovibrio sp.]